MAFFFLMIRRPPRSTLFPSRRSSDLGTASLERLEEEINQAQYRQAAQSFCRLVAEERSEEHTSELQSLRHLVCRLLLEKKNNKTSTDFNSQRRRPTTYSNIMTTTPTL